MTSKALINPSTLEAARRRAGVDHAALAARLKLARGAERIGAWERGDDRPTFAQARSVAQALRVPFASLFMAPASLGSDDLPDLRTVGARSSRCSPDLVEVYRDAQRKQEWVREVREREGQPPVSLVGAWPGSFDVGEVAAVIVAALGLSAAQRKRAGRPDGYLRAWVAAGEACGVLVLRSSTVGSNTHRRLDVEEFRGFAIADPKAPLVFINTADAEAARVFTFIHELAHLVRADSGVSQSGLVSPTAPLNDIERFCDRVAAEVLVPLAELQTAWDPGLSLAENCEALKQHFKVSAMVVARRAADEGLADRAEYAELVRALVVRRATPRESDGGPDSLVLVRLRNGGVVTDMVTQAVRSGTLLWRDAGALLGVPSGTVAKLVDQAAR